MGERAIGYFRVSTDRQSEHGVSLDVQLDRFTAYTKQHAYEPVGTYTDVESGRHNDRAAYQKMLSALRAGQADVVVIQFLDRFGRDAKEILRRIWELDDLGVRIEATDEPLGNGDSLYMMIGSHRAEQESRRIAERVKGGMVHKAREDVHWLHGRVPFGWKREREAVGDQLQQRIVIDEPAATILRLMATLYLDGASFRGIANRLNALDHRSQTGVLWRPVSVRWVLQRECNGGMYSYTTTQHGAAVQVRVPKFPPLFDAPTITALAERFRLRADSSRRALGGRFLLAGLVTCGLCNGALVSHTGGRKTKPVRAYLCARSRDGAGCVANYHNADRLERWLLDYLQGIADPAAIERLLPAAPELSGADAERATLTATLDRLDAAFARAFRLFLDGTLTDERQYKLANAEIQRQQAAVRTQLDALDARATLAARYRDRLDVLPRIAGTLVENFAILSMPERKALLQQLIVRIVLAPGAPPQLHFTM